MRPIIAFRLISALMFVTAVTACGGGEGDPTDPVDATVGSVAVIPGAVTLNSLGATSQLSASATSTGGTGVPGTTFTWVSSNTAAATVDANGLVTAVANGTTTVTATASGSSVSGTSNVTVAQTAASIAVTTPSETVTAGQTVQLSAMVEDAGGSALSSPNLAWSSSEPDLATVDGAGVVSALRSGVVTITASQDGTSGTSGLTVVRGDFIPTADATLGGVVEVATLTVAAGVTVTLTADAVIDAEGPVTISGGVTGDCMGLSLNGRSDVTISGTFSNVCSATSADVEPPDLVILGTGTVDLDGATITSSGDITLGNVSAAAAAAAPARSAIAGASLLTLDGTFVGMDPAVAPPGLDGVVPGDGQDGHGITIRPIDLLYLNGTTLQAQNGGAGGSSEVEGNAGTVVSRGGSGASGGSVHVETELVSLSLVSVGPITVQINAGKGGAGGSGKATGLWDVDIGELPPTSSSGGDGGSGGNSFIVDSFFDVFFDITVDPGGTVAVNPGDGGVGGPGISVGPGGFPPDIPVPPGDFGTATATGGAGGHSGTGPIGSDFLSGTAMGGSGGSGTAMGVNGSNGDDLLGGNGFPGGNAIGFGGSGGNSFGAPGAAGGDVIVSGGNGGNAGPNCPGIITFDFGGTIQVVTDTDLSDFFIFNAGTGQLPLQLSGVNVGEGGGPGFAGGNGGDLLGTAGTPGFNWIDLLDVGPPGTLFVGPGGNGGAMGRGLSQGSGGLAGSGPSGTFDGLEPVFADGFESGDVSAWSCSGQAPARAAGATPAAGSIAVQTTPGTMTLSGTAPWVTVTGAIAEDGTFTATGVGTVAGNPNTSVSFSGTFDEQAGTMTGEYSMDTESVISPGHPVVYGLDMMVTPPATAVGGNP